MSRTLLSSIYFFITFLAFGQNIRGQEKDSSHTQLPQQNPDIIQLTTFIRMISDAKGNKRIDENMVANIKLTNWLRFEGGIRFGQRPAHFNSYYHYKLELQTKYFWNYARLFARVSNNILNAPGPQYRKTNKLAVIETRIPFSSYFTGYAGVGYLLSSQEFNSTEALPINQGIQNNYPIYRLAVRYWFKNKVQKNKGFLEAVYGTYDVFNPYDPDRPFTQLITEYELGRTCSLYSYFRYQFYQNLYTPVNYFFCIGTIFHIR